MKNLKKGRYQYFENTIGNNVTLTLFGESHGSSVGAVLDGVAPGVFVDEEYIRRALDMRRPAGNISTQRREPDSFSIESGVFKGRTTGTPITVIIKNENVNSGDYTYGPARPGHADYTVHEKYHGFEDYRGGGHFSGRVTAGIVAACAILRAALEKKDILIGSHISSLCSVKDRDFIDYTKDITALNRKYFPVLSEEAEIQMTSVAENCAKEGDSIGGVLQTAVIGVEAGVGEPFFSTVEGELAKALFAVPGVKGVSFGLGFDFARSFGSEANDIMHYEDGKVVFDRNNNGGINGGITNGAPIIINTAIKPTPSIFKPQSTVDFVKGTDIIHTVKGRHDPMIIHRARAVVDALTALVISDLLTVRYGDDYLKD